MRAEGAELGVGRPFEVEIPHDEDADVAGVVMLHMGAFPLQRTALPDVAGPVDREVVADVRPPLPDVRPSDQIESCLGG